MKIWNTSEISKKCSIYSQYCCCSEIIIKNNFLSKLNFCVIETLFRIYFLVKYQFRVGSEMNIPIIRTIEGIANI